MKILIFRCLAGLLFIALMNGCATISNMFKDTVIDVNINTNDVGMIVFAKNGDWGTLNIIANPGQPWKIERPEDSWVKFERIEGIGSAKVQFNAFANYNRLYRERKQTIHIGQQEIICQQLPVMPMRDMTNNPPVK